MTPFAAVSYTHLEVIAGSAQIFGIDVGRCDVTGFTTALTRIGRVECKGQEATLGHCLRIQAR